MATFLVYGQFYPYVNPVHRSGSNNRSQAIAILASVLCKKMRLAIPTLNSNSFRYNTNSRRWSYWICGQIRILMTSTLVSDAVTEIELLF